MERKTQNAERRTTTKNFKLFLILLSFIMGCATIQEAAKGTAGVSTKVLEEGRKEAIVKRFNYDYNTCYKKIKATLQKKGSYIYAQSIKKHMIALYVSEDDTTPVGIFFKEIDANNTQIEVSSPSKFAKELIARKVQKMEAEENVERETGDQ